MERATGIEPAFSAWEADVLPLNYARERAPHYRLAAMVLSDRTIREELEAGRIVIDPLGDDCIQPSSVDLHVDQYFRLFRNHTQRVIDVREDQEDLTELVDVGSEAPLDPAPRGVRARDRPWSGSRLPDDLVARLEGKSSLGRLGLLIHSTAGFVDAGWDGHLTLELSNVANLPITVYPGMKIGQISFLQDDHTGRAPLRLVRAWVPSTRANGGRPRAVTPTTSAADVAGSRRDAWSEGAPVGAGDMFASTTDHLTSSPGGPVPVRIAIGMAVTVIAIAIAGRRFHWLSRLIRGRPPGA